MATHAHAWRVVLVVLVLAGFGTTPTADRADGVLAGAGSSCSAAAAAPASIMFVDVGQGDGVVMKIGGKIIVSDAGERHLDHVEAALECLGAKRIDVAILSHPHDDHIRNFAALFAGFEVRKAVLSRSAWWQGTDANTAVVGAIEAEGLQPTYVRAGQTSSWGGARWEILNPPEGSFTGGKREAANASIAYLLRVNGAQLLFTGDILKPAALKVTERLKDRVRGRIDVFLATHHGSKEGSLPELLDVARPRWAVLSTGPNGYHHPTPEAINRLKSAGASIWCTDPRANGTITVRVSAGGSLSWSADGASTAPWWSALTRDQHGTCVDR